MTYTKDNSASLTPTFAGPCTCNNYLREIEYEVQLETKVSEAPLQSGAKQLVISSVKANIVLGDKVEASECTIKTGVT